MKQPRPTRRERRRDLLVVAACAVLVLWASVAQASEGPQYDPLEAGHPLRLAAYVLHPIGVAADYCLMRPAYWLVQHEPLATIFGAEQDPRARDTQKSQPGQTP